ncbi:MAG: hypothetical protein J1G02_06300 [Clostridiales bacterium]|nr:hypothetical protein [Clostridiales bacterium]
MKHKIKLGLYLTVGIVLILFTKVLSLPVENQMPMCVCGIVFLLLSINELLDYLFYSIDEWKTKSDEQKSNKGDDNI